MSNGYAVDIRRLREQVGALVAKHEKTQDIESFEKYADDPAGFMRDVLRCEPWSMQVEMAVRIRDNARTVVVTANGLGKDWATARIALWWAFACRGMVILTGPTERQVKQILMREVRVAFAAAPELPGELYALELRIDNDSGILAFTSDDASRLTGYHHPRLLICVTEGQGVSDDAYEAAAACCTGAKNRLFVYGNPTNPSGSFFRAAQSDNWNVLTIPATAHPNVISGRAEIPGAVSREWIALMAEEYGSSSSIYRARVLAEFPEESVEGLIRRSWIRAAFERFNTGELENAAARQPLILALDVARFGPDASVLAVVQGPVVRELVTWRGASITETCDRVIAHAERVWEQSAGGRAGPPPRIYVDEPGLGGGAIDVLRRKDWRVRPFNGASTPIDGTRFANTRAESHWAFRTLLENGKVAIPPDATLEEEALAVEWQINMAGKIQMLSKDTIRATIGRSPDRLDAVIIGLAMSVGGLKRDVGTFAFRL